MPQDKTGILDWGAPLICQKALTGKERGKWKMRKEECKEKLKKLLSVAFFVRKDGEYSRRISTELSAYDINYYTEMPNNLATQYMIWERRKSLKDSYDFPRIV